MDIGTNPDKGHLWKQDWARDLGQSRPETVNSTGAGTGEQLLSEWARARDHCGSSRKFGTFEGVHLSQDPCGSGHESGTSEGVGLSQDLWGSGC